jgi:hypothetical protein
MSQFSVRSIIDNFQYYYLMNNFEENQLSSFSKWIYNGHHKNIRYDSK